MVFDHNLTTESIQALNRDPSKGAYDDILNDLNFNNIGNTSESKNYKDVLRDIFNDIVELVKEKALSEDFLNKLENFDPKQIENKIKDKLKNKLKKLVK